MWFIGVEVEQETSAPPPKKNPGSAPGFNPTPANIMNMWCIFVITKQYFFQRVCNYFSMKSYFCFNYRNAFFIHAMNYFSNVYQELFFNWAENYFLRYLEFIFWPTMHCGPCI